MYHATVCKLKDLSPIRIKSDNIQLAKANGYQVIVSITAKEDDLGLYFPAGTQLSEDFCKANELVGDGKLFSNKRRVRCIRLRGELSDGFFIPITSLSYIDQDLSDLKEGQTFTHYKGSFICQQYFNEASLVLDDDCVDNSCRGKNSKNKKISHPLFFKHSKTKYLKDNVQEITEGDWLIYTEKLHGTSARVAKLPVKIELGIFKKFICTLFGITPVSYKPEILVGTRTRELGGLSSKYGAKEKVYFRKNMARKFADKLRLGETVYSEIVGYFPNGRPLLPAISKEKLGREYSSYKNTIDNSMHFKYGNDTGECSQYVYRITQIDENGVVYDLSWNQLKRRCLELGLNHVPELKVEYIDTYDYNNVLINADFLSYGRDVIDSSHIREGVVVRVENELGVKFLKHKSVDFKILEDSVADEPNIEELS